MEPERREVYPDRRRRRKRRISCILVSLPFVAKKRTDLPFTVFASGYEPGGSGFHHRTQ